MFSASINRFYQLSARYLVVAAIATASLGLVFAPAQSDAARLGGGKSFGTQSFGATRGAAPVTTQRSAAPTAAAAPSTPPSSASAPRSGASRFLGPLAGIAAGLGIGMLMSHLGFGGAMGEILTLVIFAALAFFAIRMVTRLFLGRGQSAQTQSAAVLANAYPQAAPPAPQQMPQQMWRQADASASGATASPVTPPSGVASGSSAAESDEAKWFIPADFDTQSFIQEAKKHFVAIQKIWDSGDVTQLHQFLTDDLIKALQGQFDGRQGVNETEVVMLNAELLGMEKVTDGHLASVRFSGMLRETPQTEAFRFEEIWNLFKSEQGGWMLAGIQQIPVELAS